MAILAECPICHRKQSIKNKQCAGCGDDLEKQKRNDNARFWVVYRIDGKQRKEFAGYSIQDAKNAEGKRKGQKREGRILEMLPQSRITFKALSEWFLSEMQTEVDLTEMARVKGKTRRGPSRSYLRRIKSVLNMFNAEFGDRLVSGITTEALKRYCNRREVDISAYTLDVEMKTIRGMINAAFDSDKVDGAVLKAFRKIKTISTAEDKVRKRALTIDEYLRLVDAAPLHLKAMIVIGVTTGMRVGEIRQLRWAHVDRKAGVFRLPREITKTKRARIVPVSPQIIETINSLPRHLHGFVITFNGNPMVGLSGVKRGFESACKKAGLKYGLKQPNGIIFHDLRRTAKTNMLKAGVGKEYRDMILGHSLQGMDRHYISESELEGELCRAMDVYSAWLIANVAQTVAHEKVN